MSQITELIDKQDNFEIIRDKVAQILADESAAQQQLAVDAGKNPALWRLNVYTERAVPWDEFDDGDVIVNVWFDNADARDRSSDTVERQWQTSTINVDVVGFGESTSSGSGQMAGDEVASRNADRGLRLVRNILMSSFYTYLDLRGIVGQRWPQSITKFQPQQDGRPVTHTVGARLALAVQHNEFSPQYVPHGLEIVSTEIQRAEDGRVLATVEIDYTQP